jgi:hypothetical protein
MIGVRLEGALVACTAVVCNGVRCLYLSEERIPAVLECSCLLVCK